MHAFVWHACMCHCWCTCASLFFTEKQTFNNNLFIKYFTPYNFHYLLKMFTLIVWVHAHKSSSLENEKHLPLIFSSNISLLTIFTTSQKCSLSYSRWSLFSFLSQFCFRWLTQAGDKLQALTTCKTTRTRSILIMHTIQRLSALGSSPCHQQYHSSVISSKQHCKRFLKKKKKNSSIFCDCEPQVTMRVP